MVRKKNKNKFVLQLTAVLIAKNKTLLSSLSSYVPNQLIFVLFNWWLLLFYTHLEIFQTTDNNQKRKKKYNAI
jgi:hypothetical protein